MRKVGWKTIRMMCIAEQRLYLDLIWVASIHSRSIENATRRMHVWSLRWHYNDLLQMIYCDTLSLHGLDIRTHTVMKWNEKHIKSLLLLRTIFHFSFIFRGQMKFIDNHHWINSLISWFLRLNASLYVNNSLNKDPTRKQFPSCLAHNEAVSVLEPVGVTKSNVRYASYGHESEASDI